METRLFDRGTDDCLPRAIEAAAAGDRDAYRYVFVRCVEIVYAEFAGRDELSESDAVTLAMGALSPERVARYRESRDGPFIGWLTDSVAWAA